MKTVDFHAHPVPDAFRTGLSLLGIDVLADDGFPLPQWSAEDHLKFMDEAGIDCSVLSLPSPHIHHGSDVASLKAARAINDELCVLSAAHPDRFLWTACLPLPYAEGSLQEIRRCLDVLGAAGVKVPTNADGIYLRDPAMDDVMAALNERHALVILHPCRAQERPANVITGQVAALYEYPADTTRAVLNMIAHRTMTRFPNIRFLVPHCGSFCRAADGERRPINASVRSCRIRALFPTRITSARIIRNLKMRSLFWNTVSMHLLIRSL